MILLGRRALQRRGVRLAARPPHLEPALGFFLENLFMPGLEVLDHLRSPPSHAFGFTGACSPAFKLIDLPFKLSGLGPHPRSADELAPETRPDLLIVGEPLQQEPRDRGGRIYSDWRNRGNESGPFNVRANPLLHNLRRDGCK